MITKRHLYSSAGYSVVLWCKNRAYQQKYKRLIFTPLPLTLAQTAGLFQVVRDVANQNEERKNPGSRRFEAERKSNCEFWIPHNSH